MFLRLLVLALSLCCISATPKSSGRVETNNHGITHYYWNEEYIGCSYILRNKIYHLNNRGYEAGEVTKFWLQMAKDSHEGNNKFKKKEIKENVAKN